MNETIVEAGKKLELVLIHDNHADEKHVIRLAGAGASVRIDEIFASPEETTSKVTVVHEAPDTTSRVYTRGIVPKGHATAYAHVIMSPGAHRSDSFVSQQFMLLNKDARATTIPALEVEVDDVKAGHAATVSQIDEKALFYLMSRGLSRTQAENLLIRAFLKLPKQLEHVIEQWNRN